MKRILKIMFIIFIGVFPFMLTSCKNPHKDQKVSIKDLDWKVELGVLNGKKYALFSFTNNSDYVIHELKIEHTPTKKLKGNRLDEFYQYFQQEYNVPDDEMDWLKEEGYLRIDANIYEIYSDPIKPGETSEYNECVYYGMYRVLNMDYYDMFEPNTAIIKYEDNGMLYTVYYDFINNSYTHDAIVEKIN